MGKNVTYKELEQAHSTIANWFIEQNQLGYEKPITMIDSNINYGGEEFRIITHFSFYGRGEKPKLEGSDE